MLLAELASPFISLLLSPEMYFPLQTPLISDEVKVKVKIYRNPINKLHRIRLCEISAT
jgi:hypothetical protein